MADFNQNIKVTASTKDAERELSKLEKILKGLNDFKIDLGKNSVRGLDRIAESFGAASGSVNRFGRELQSGAIRGGITALGLALGKLTPATTPVVAGIGKVTTAVTGLTAKATGLVAGFGGIGAAVASAGSGIDSAARAAATTGTALQHLLEYVKDIPSAWGLAAVALAAFAPAAIKAGKAVNNAVGQQATQQIAELAGGIQNATTATQQLTGRVVEAANAFESLLEGASLNQLNRQLRDANKQVGEFAASTVEAWEAAQQLVSAQRLQTAEQKKINDLVRRAKGQQPQDVRDYEFYKRKNDVQSGRFKQEQAAQQAKDVDQLQAALLKLERASAAVENNKLQQRWELDQAAAAKLRAETEALAAQLDKVARASNRTGIRKTEATAAVQERKELERSVALMRERNALLRGNANQYGGMAGPGNDTRANQPQYREMLNKKAITDASKTLEIQYNWNRALKQGVSIAAEMRKIQADDLVTQQRKTAELAKQQQLESQKLGRQRLEGVAIGGAFPLLFGGGFGSVAGGALGGLNTANPIFSVFTSAIGQMLDQFAAAAQDTAKALRDPIENFEELAQKGILASSTQEKYVRGLIEAGKAYEALAIVQQEVIKKVGVEGAKDLALLGDNAAKLSRTWQEFNFQMQAALAGPMADLLGWINSVLAVEVQTGRKNAATTDFLTQLRKESPAAYNDYLSRSRALAEANGGKVNDAQVNALRKEYLPGGVKQAIKTTPAAELASKTRAGEISELQAEVDLAAKRLALTGLTLERDGQRYVIAARNVAQQEYENRLLEIKNSWIGKVFDKEKNLAMIRAANLKLANDIKGIEYQIAQNQEQQYTAALQVDSQRSQEALRTLDLNEQIARTQDGEMAALYNTITLMDKRTDRQQEILQNEYDIAMVEARRNGTQAAVDALYTARLENLTKEANLNKMIAQQKLAQLAIEEEFERRRRNAGFRAEEQNVLLGAPSNRNPLEEAMYQIDRQQTDLIGPKLDRVQELKDLLGQPTGVFSTEQVTRYRQELTDLEVNILTLGGNFDKLRGMTRVWSDQQVQVEALAMAVNGFGNAITNVFGNLINQTQSWNDVLVNTLQQLGSLLFSAGLSALAGSDGRGLFSFLNGTFTGKASGGTVNGGTPYIVGEKGPELFVPGRTGTIVPNDKLGGGTGYVPSNASEAMRRYLPGRGAAAAGGASGDGGSADAAANRTVNVAYTVERINERNYVTEEAFRAGMKQAARQGAENGYAKTMGSMRNSRATRSRLGMG